MNPRIRRFVIAVGLFLAHGLRSLRQRAGRLLRDGLARAEAWLRDSKKATYGLAVTRILLGLSAVGLLVSNWRTRLYAFGSGSLWNGEGLEPKGDFPQIWLFSAFHHAMANDLLYSALYLLLLALAVAFMLGWRTRILHPIFFVLWVSFIEANDMLGDQGDNMFRIALFFMLFANVGMRWSLDARRRDRRRENDAHPADSQPSSVSNDAPLTAWGQIQNGAHNLVLVILTAQVSFVYVAGALYKAGGAAWSGGYAVYNPLMTERFGPWPWLSEVATAWGPLVTLATWGSIIMQLSFPFMLLTRPTRIIGLTAVLTFHVAIAVLMGLPWFSLAMIAIDAIFIRDRTWQRMSASLRARASASAERARRIVPA